ncbi:Serine transporter [Klebsiella pneumoniae]|nr:Serine transporter [Klebsiella pneumoniae]
MFRSQSGAKIPFGSLFGTAIGAGAVLPINAGIGGFWPLLIVFAFPITYLAHRGLAIHLLFQYAGKQYCYWRAFWRAGGKIFTVIYFFAISDYAVAITRRALSPPVGNGRASRSLVAIVLILRLMFIVRFGQRLIMRVMSTGLSFIISFYGTFLIPHWNGAILQTVSFSATGDGGIMLSLWMTFPVLVMSFNHYPIISPMVVRQRYGLAR